MLGLAGPVDLETLDEIRAVGTRRRIVDSAALLLSREPSAASMVRPLS